MSNTNAMVAHLWAQRDKPRGQSSNGNFSFEGPTLYSYSTPIARFIDTPKGTAILITSRTYSNTTSGKHMPALHRSLSDAQGRKFRVPNLGSRYSGGMGTEDHEANMAHLADRYRETRDKTLRMRDYYGSEDTLRNGLIEKADRLKAYADLFKCRRFMPRFNPAKDAADVMAKRAEREAKRNTPAYLAKREKARAQREALKHLATIERIAAWKRGEPVQLRWGEGRDEAGGTLLRIKGDTLETSQGARVPLAHAIRVFRFVKLCKERGEGWTHNGHALRVGHFQVNSVEANGDFHAGCHFIRWPETEAAALAAGVADQPAEDTRELSA